MGATRKYKTITKIYSVTRYAWVFADNPDEAKLKARNEASDAIDGDLEYDHITVEYIEDMGEA